MKRYQKVLAAMLIFVTITTLIGCQSPDQENGDVNKAAIVDQLYLLESNPAFITGATRILESYGFTVELWQGEEITVDFYRKLPEKGYKMIILRVHSGILLSLEKEGIETLETTYIFTGETYTTTKYVSEQLTDKVSNALMTEDYPLVFAVNSEFVRSASGDYDNTIIIAMGCESHYLDDMPLAFVEKGASTYIGWNALVSLDYVDGAILDLLSNLCTKNMTVAQGMARTMDELGNDPYYDTYMKLHPSESGNKTISELIE